jgi:PhoPQ-activated pathogenicity-related protein
MKLLLTFVLFCTAAAARADLFSYVARPEPQSSWSLVEKSELGGCDIYTLKLKSQVWQGIAWEHDLVLFRPKDADVQDKMYLLNNGGKFKPTGLPYGVMLAGMMKAPVAILMGIPNQPLFDGKREDDLIAETFVRYLETSDESWPLLFPMVKSLVKAMDVVQEFTGKEWPKPIEKFIVGGASKRGWTTWLTAAADSRVMAITPMVIDVLKMPEQMKRQVECFGGPSEQIRPYTARGLVPMPETDIAQRLWKWVDPWTYRAKFTLPKLVVLGNNDRYWAPDALNLYWNDLPGPKWISYTPNAGHNLTTKEPNGQKGNPMRAVQATAAFVRYQMTGKSMPKVDWKHDDADGQMRLTVTAHPTPKEVRMWRCVAPTKDTREARWESKTVEFKNGQAQILEPLPASGVVSFYADCAYEIDGLPYSLCTQLRLAESKPDAVR